MESLPLCDISMWLLGIGYFDVIRNFSTVSGMFVHGVVRSYLTWVPLRVEKKCTSPQIHVCIASISSKTEFKKALVILSLPPVIIL